MGDYLTPIQNIALRLVFDVMDECQYNRTYDDYMRISEALPPLKKLHYLVNARLKELHQAGPLPEICRFAAGHRRTVYEPYPREISYETLRAALTISGMRREKRRKKSQANIFRRDFAA